MTVNPDRSYNLQMSHPPFSYYIKQAAGIQRGAMEFDKQIAGMISRKHVYEIAKIKQNDPAFQNVSLESVCKTVMGSARSIGIEVVSGREEK